VLMIPGVFELDMNRGGRAKPQRQPQATGRLGIGTTGNPARSG
jgi:hypothetical protein